MRSQDKAGKKQRAAAAVDIQSLRYSVLAAEHQSFRKTATALGVRQSVLSRRIRSLEDEIGVSIFERHSGGVRLTYAGVEFTNAIRSALEDIDAAVTSAGSAGTGQVGKLTLGISVSLSKGELRQTLMEYAAMFPDVTLEICEGSRQKLASGIKSGAIDIGMVAGDIDGTIGDAMVLWNERIMAALPAGHALSNRAEVQWRDICGEPFFGNGRDSGTDTQALIERVAPQSDRPSIAFRNVSRENALSMVGAGRGVSLLEESATGVTYPGVIYRRVRTADGPAVIDNVAYWNHGNSNPALRRFLTLLRVRYSSRKGNEARGSFEVAQCRSRLIS